MISFLKRRLKLIILTAIIAFAGVFFFQNYFSAKTSATVATTKVKRGTLEEKLTVSGEIDAEEKTTLKFQTSGKLAWIGVKEGDFVKKYQLVASLDQRELKLNLDKYLNNYMSQRWDFDQTKEDNETVFFSNSIRRILEKAQFDLNNSVIDVELKDLAIRLANLITPIDGIVTKVSAPYAGVNITPTSADIDIVNPQTVYFSALADQTEVTKIREGMSGELILDSYTDETFPGFVKNISFSPKSGETGTVYAVKFLFDGDNSTYKFRLGMTGDLTFITKRIENALFLPSKFIKNQNGKKFVNVKKKDKIEKVSIETGLETDNGTQITEGLTENTIVTE